MSFSQSPPEITEILRAWSDGNREAADALVPLVYDELRRQARRHLRREHLGHTLQATALVNEAYLKLIDQRGFESRTHFFAIAATLMRRILVDHAKAKHRGKRGGSALKVPLEEILLVSTDETNTDLLALNEALERLVELDEQQARIVELRYFGGLNIEETAAVLKLSEATVNRDWKMAKAWLRHELTRTA